MSAVAATCRLFCLCCSVFWVDRWPPCEADGDCPAPPEVLARKPACSLVSKVSPGLQLPLSSPYGSGCLSPAGDGLSFVLCSVLAVSYVRAFRMVAIPQSGLLAHVRSFWLRVGHSCPILTNLCSPRLPRFPALPPLASGGCRRLCCFSAGGVTVGLVICWFKLFIYFSFLLCSPLCFQGSPQTGQGECLLVFGNLSS